MRPDLMLPFVGSIVETVQLPLSSSASGLQQICRDISASAKAEGDQPQGLVDLFFLACMLLLAALRSDRALAINQHLSGAVLLVAATLIAQLEPLRAPPAALRQAVGNHNGLNELAATLLNSAFAHALLEEVAKETGEVGVQGALRLGAAAKRLILR